MGGKSIVNNKRFAANIVNKNAITILYFSDSITREDAEISVVAARHPELRIQTYGIPNTVYECFEDVP